MVRISWMMLSDQVAAPLEKNKETISSLSLPLTPSRHILFFFFSHFGSLSLMEI